MVLLRASCFHGTAWRGNPREASRLGRAVSADKIRKVIVGENPTVSSNGVIKTVSIEEVRFFGVAEDTMLGDVAFLTIRSESWRSASGC